MRDYGVVSPQIWIGKTGKALRGNMSAQLVALYLMTSPHANMIGVYYCPIDTIAKETGLTLEGASEALRSLETAGYCHFDPSTEEVFVVRMAAFQVGEQLDHKDNRCKGIARDVMKIMSDKLRSGFRAIYSGAFHLPEIAPKPTPAPTPAQAPQKPLRSQEQDQEQGQEQEHSAIAGGEPPDYRALVFSQGVPLLTAAGVIEKHARSMLANLSKLHGESAVYDAILQTARDGAGEPVGWLQKLLAKSKPKSHRPTSHTGLANKDYHQGVAADGTLV
jgi:hypothetical protein